MIVIVHVAKDDRDTLQTSYHHCGNELRVCSANSEFTTVRP